jgi:membrane-bound serine protease (ClpP class)
MLSIVLILAAFGILMIAMEVVLPGGVLGVAGAIAIIISLVLTGSSPGLDSIGSSGRFALAGGIIVTTVILLFLWLKFFTRASFVKNHLLEDEVGGTSTYDQYEALLDLSGTAETDLRPAGKAQLEGRRWDVLAESGLIEKGTQIKVVLIEGSRVVVRPVS